MSFALTARARTASVKRDDPETKEPAVALTDGETLKTREKPKPLQHNYCKFE